ncbi:hypothetical protein PG995_010736 [Apiospora arundinis]
MEATHKQEYRIRELETRSVTLFTGRAQIFRQLKDVPLKAGENQITIVGLTPTVDRDSIKVEGTGSAIITDIAVELLPNREIFEDVYPEYDEDDSDDSDPDSDIEQKKEDSEKEEMVQLREKIRTAEDEGESAQETVNSSNNRLEILNAYGKLVTTDRQHAAPDVNIDEVLVTYRAEREKVFADMMDGKAKFREVTDTLQRLKKELKRMESQAHKERARANKLKRKEAMAQQKQKQKEARKQQEVLKERARLRKERESFWPKKVYSVRITLDANPFTPGSSRRNSIASGDVDLVSSPKAPSHNKSGSNSSDAGFDGSMTTCDLSLSYVTTDAYWSPAYDLVLSTTANTGHVCFDAQLTNQTSETWANCKITLSTPQADFSGLHDTIPTLAPWRVRLMGRAHYGGAPNNIDIMYSRDEKNHRAAWADKHAGRGSDQPPRSELFGLPAWGVQQQRISHFQPACRKQVSEARVFSDSAPPGMTTQASGASGLFGGVNAPPPPPVPRAGSGSALFGSVASAAPASSGGLFGASTAAAPPSGYSFGRRSDAATTCAEECEEGVSRSSRKSMSLFSRAGLGRQAELRQDNFSAMLSAGPGSDSKETHEDERTILPEPPAELAFQESTFEETGFTTTYDLPGLKTLLPASTASKQRVARIGFANVAFSHTVVAKYKPVAYLQAKVRNGNKLTLLPGPAGLTLDGSFLGRTKMPRCSPGDSFTLSLGVDPAIKVVYPKPDVHRSQSGVFNKEDSAVYTRTISLSNTRSSPSPSASGSSTSTSTSQQKQPPPARVTVLDQVPVSEDERLRVEVLQPRGLALTGQGVAAGVPGREGKDEKDWGKAVATLKKGGEVSWDVTLNAGRMVKLGLEYQCILPTGDHAVNV